MVLTKTNDRCCLSILNVKVLTPFHFQLVYVVLHLTEKNFSTVTAKTEDMAAFFIYIYLQSFSTNRESWFEHTAELSSNASKRFVFRLAVFAATVSMPCVHNRHLKLHVSRKFSTYFSLGGMNE